MESEKKNQGRGGARPNSGRKRKSEEGRVSFIVSCTNDDLVQVNAAAEAFGVPRSQLVLDAVKQYQKSPRKKKWKNRQNISDFVLTKPKKSDKINTSKLTNRKKAVKTQTSFRKGKNGCSFYFT